MAKKKPGKKNPGTLDGKPLKPVGRQFTKGYIAALCVSFVLLAALVVLAAIVNRPDPDGVLSSARKQNYTHARVLEVVADNAEPDDFRAEGRRLGDQELRIEILSGDYKGTVIEMTNYLSLLFNFDLKAGDRIIVRIELDDAGALQPQLYSRYREGVVYALLIVFAALLIILGGAKGLKALLGLVFTVFCIWFLLIPLMLKGYNTILVTIGVVAAATAASLLILDGFTKKSFSAIVGCVAGVAAAGLCAALVGQVAQVSTFNMGEAEDLIMTATSGGMKIQGLMVCGVLIAALGAVMDVSMTIASSVNELHNLNKGLGFKALMRSGMNIGRDAMGTMANTLILAFAGSSLNMLILMRAYDIPYIQMINSDSILIEIIQSVAGSIGIILTVPFVALISAYVMIQGGKKKGKAG